ncbi:MAG: inositol monophosphatase [Haliscomenobacter sp.]|nr:inositol monophosphatase [Haliscomenobacter sp.]MBK8655052.1 inositol monophosphatase [Haliscomenobacter sp.]
MKNDTYSRVEGIDLSSLCFRCFPLIEETGAFISSQFGKVDDSAIEEKSLNSLVSFVDKTAEEMLIQGLSPLFPEAGFLTEEEMAVPARTASGEWQWIIDPLDGTTNFLFGLPNFAVSVALAFQGAPVLGIVYEVNRKELFYAIKGGGAFLNGKPIRAGKASVLSHALVATGFPYSQFDQLGFHLDAVGRFQRQTRGVRRWGAASVDLAFVACGRFDVFFEYALNPWDVAAGMLLVTEAGGAVSDFWGSEGDYSGRQVLATNGLLHPSALEVLAEAYYASSSMSNLSGD